MTHRPWPIVIIALFHIIAPLVNFIASAQMLEMSWSNYFDHQAHYGPTTLLIWAIPIFAGISLLTFRMWSYYAFLAFMFATALYTLYQRLLYPHHVNIFVFLLMQLVNFSVILYFRSPVVKRIYLNKRIRWWQNSPRFLIEINSRMIMPTSQIATNQSYEARILNISEGGAFINTNAQLKTHTPIELQFKIYNQEYKVPSQIIHVHNGGYGVLFEGTFTNKRELKKLSKMLKKNRVPIRGQQAGLLASFKFWWNDLMKTGHGIFPDA